MEEFFAQIIKKTTEEFLEKMGFSGEVTVVKNSSSAVSEQEESAQNNLVCNISVGEDASFLIGQYGANLQALQHLIRLLVRKRTQEKGSFIVDINHYRQQKSQVVIEQADLAAKQAVNEKRAVIMNPMSAYERRLVHLELAKNDKVVTESVGEGFDRKIIVKPIDALI